MANRGAAVLQGQRTSINGEARDDLGCFRSVSVTSPVRVKNRRCGVLDRSRNYELEWFRAFRRIFPSQVHHHRDVIDLLRLRYPEE